MSAAEVSTVGGDPEGRLVPVIYWAVGKGLIGAITHTFAPLRAYGCDRVPRHGGAVLAMNHFHAIDPACFGVACPRRVVFAAKIEAHATPGIGEFIRWHGTLAIRRGESDRDALRRMREAVRTTTCSAYSSRERVSARTAGGAEAWGCDGGRSPKAFR